MQFTTLSKLVRLFLLGSSAVLFLIPVLAGPVGALPPLRLDGESFAVPMGLIFLGLVTALGCVVEGLSDCTLQKVVRWAANSPDVAGWFLKKEHALRVARWQETFLEVLASANWPPSAELPKDSGQTSVAAAIFHKTASVDQLRYLDAHYGTFLLSSGLAVLFAGPGVLSVLQLLPDSASNAATAGLIVVCVGCSYALCILSISNFLYTWESTFRYACLWLWGQREKGEANIQGSRAVAQPHPCTGQPAEPAAGEG